MLQAPLLRVLIATPFGARQRGGIDRLTDLIADTVENSADGQIRVDRLVTRGTGSLVWAPFVFSRALVRFWKLKRRGEVDLLHINLAAGGSAIRKAFLARFAQRLGVPYVLHLHGSRFHQFWPSAGPYVRNLVDRLFAESAAIIVLGKYWSQLVTAYVPQVEKKITVLPNATAPIQLAREPAADGRVRISFLGELGQRKGTPQLVEALGRLVSRQDWTATIAGNGKVQETIARAQQLGIDDRVKVPGWLDSSAINEVLRQTDIFVLPSFAENLPMSILEAFACGIAVIATPVGAVEDVITHESNGLLVPVGDVDALASAIRRLIEDGTLRDALGAAAQRDHARYYEIGAYMSRLTTIWFNAADSVNSRKCM
jgi:glycosyltransferase involved in cell wall biosynthesis